MVRIRGVVAGDERMRPSAVSDARGDVGCGSNDTNEAVALRRDKNACQ